MDAVALRGKALELADLLPGHQVAHVCRRPSLPRAPKIPRVSMTLKKWGHYPKSRGHVPIFKGSWRLQVEMPRLPSPKEPKATAKAHPVLLQDTFKLGNRIIKARLAAE